MRINLKIWRQENPTAKGRLEDYTVDEVTEDTSFLEMLDILNEDLNDRGIEPVAFDHDCREGICGTCGLVINGRPHGNTGTKNTTTCQLHMRSFRDGETITIEPWRANAFPIIKDLVVDRTAFDRIVAAGGFISVNTGAAPEAHAMPVPKAAADRAFEAAACIGCGACVAACPNASGMLFMGSKVVHLAELPQGQPERWTRVQSMVATHDAAGFGGCTNIGECQVSCPKDIQMDVISSLNADLRRSLSKARV